MPFPPLRQLCLLLLLVLAGALVRGADTLTTVEQVRKLSTDEALEGRPVQLSGTISYHRMTDRDFNFNLHDATGGIMVYPKVRLTLTPGQHVTVRGVTTVLGHGVRIAEATVEPGATGSLPTSIPAALGAVRDGSFDGDFVEVEGTVRLARLESLEVRPQRLALEFGPQRQRLTAWISEFDAQRDLLPPGTRVKVRGVVVRWTNPLGQTQSVSVLTNSMREVEVVSPPAPATARTLGQVQTEIVGLSARRVAVEGTVTFASPSLLVLQTGDAALRVRGDFSAAAIAVGKLISAEGFPALGEYTVELEDAAAAVSGVTAMPVEPESLARAADVLSGKQFVMRDGRLVRLPARLLSIRDRDDAPQLELQSEGRTFAGFLPAGTRLPDSLRAGSEMMLTGICALHFSDERRRLGRSPDRFSLQLRGVDDILTTKAGPWWTAERLQVALGVSALLALIVIAWAVMLGAKNRRLRQEIAGRLRAEQDLANERRRVANQLHDTLQQTILAASLQLHAAHRLMSDQPREAAESLDLGRHLLDRGRDEVRDAVWDLRMDDKASVDLADLLKRLCQELNHARGTAVTFTGELPVSMPSHLATQLVRIVREAVTNALKHSGARAISVRLELREGQQWLVIHDDGCGFDPTQVPGPETGHFGLGGMRERAERLGASFQLSSAPGRDTTIELSLPQP